MKMTTTERTTKLNEIRDALKRAAPSRYDYDDPDDGLLASVHAEHLQAVIEKLLEFLEEDE